MPKIAEYIKSLAEKAGIPADNAELVKLLSMDTIKDVDVDPGLTNLIDRNLMTLAAAKSNPDVKAAIEKTFKAELYNGLDAEVNDTMTELGLTDAQKAEILAEKGSNKRAMLLAKKMKDWESVNNKDATTADKKELLQKVNDLNTNISKIQREKEDALKQKDVEIAEKLLQKDMEFDLLGFKFALPKETPASVKMAAAKDSVNRRLAEKGLKVVSTETGARKIVRADGTDYFDENNKAVSYNDFISGALAQDKLLLVSDDAGDGGGGNGQFPKKVEGGNQDNQKVNQHLVASADEDLKNVSDYVTN